ncbi:hypothetical protein EDD22DRAFT_788983 [Suillus occidentalis]|nr:hypothetical protein EDD22DRAFT_788983 [Suillus occidentalis]
MYPELDQDYVKSMFPAWSKSIGGGYAPLRQQERSWHPTTVAEGIAIHFYLERFHPQSPEFAFFASSGCYQVIHWAHLQLSNGQISCSLFTKYETKPNARQAHNAKVSPFVKPQVGQKIYLPHSDTFPLTLVSLYSDPDHELLKESYATFYSCSYHGDEGLAVISTSSIQSVVAMVPHKLKGESRVFIFKKPGLDIADLRGFLTNEEDPSHSKYES